MKPSLLLLPSLALALTMSLASCGDGHDSTANLANNPPSPTSGGDDSVVNQNTPKSGGENTATNTEGTGTGGTVASQTGSSGSGSGGGEEGSQPIPEPATFFLLGTGLAAAAVYRRRKAPSQAE